jgi:hypothetical protein
MTKTQLIRGGVAAAAVAALLVVAHLVFLPVDASWGTNRILHHVWQGAVGLAAVGGGVWVLWPRPKPRRRNEQRDAARRRLIGLAVLVVAAVALVTAMELRRIQAGRSYLDPAIPQLQAIGRAIEAYAGAHEGERPEAIGDLVPQYLGREALYFPHRSGPAEALPPEAEGEAGYSYHLAQQRVTPAASGAPEGRRPDIVAFLEPGLTWSAQPVVLTGRGTVRLVGGDLVGAVEAPAPAGE